MYVHMQRNWETAYVYRQAKDRCYLSFSSPISTVPLTCSSSGVTEIIYDDRVKPLIQINF